MTQDYRHDDNFGMDENDYQHPQILTVACVKWGGLYGPEYVHRLKAGVARHLKIPHRFVCLTDDPSGLDGVDCIDLPPGLTHWWGKLYLFSPEMVGLGRILFFDLDTVIVGNIDFLAQYRGQWACLSGFYHPFRCGSGVMSIGKWQQRYATWLSYRDDRTWAEAYCGQLGDGHWMQLSLGVGDRWQKMHPDKLVSYKVHCTDGIPEGAAVVNFHGEPRPHDCAHLDWMREHWIGDSA